MKLISYLLLFIFFSSKSFSQSVTNLYSTTHGDHDVRVSVVPEAGRKNVLKVMLDVKPAMQKYVYFSWRIPLGNEKQDVIEIMGCPGKSHIEIRKEFSSNLILNKYKIEDLDPSFFDQPSIIDLPKLNYSINENGSVTLDPQLSGNVPFSGFIRKVNGVIRKGPVSFYGKDLKLGLNNIRISFTNIACANSIQKDITINVTAVPMPVITISDENRFIEEGQKILIKSHLEKSEYRDWFLVEKNVAGEITENSFNRQNILTISPTSSATYYLKGILKSGKVKTSEEVFVNVKKAPDPPHIVSQSKDTVIWKGDKIAIGIKTSSFIAGTQIRWQNDPSIEGYSVNKDTIYVRPQKNNEYKVNTFLRTRYIEKQSVPVSIKVNVKLRSSKPDSILGQMQFWKNCQNNLKNSISYRISGGFLGTGSGGQWQLFEGDCSSGKKIFQFSGNQFKLPLPSETKTYSISPKNIPDQCYSFTIFIEDAPTRPDSILISDSFVCQGKNITLSLNEPISSLHKLTWTYSEKETGKSLVLGTNSKLEHQPVRSGTYVVSIYHPCGLAYELTKYVEVESKPIFSPIQVDPVTNSKKNLSILDEYGYTYSWYSDLSGNNLIGIGKSVSVSRRIKSVYVFGEKKCGYLPVAEMLLDWHLFRYKFLNMGFSSNDFRRFKVLHLTWGSETYYVKAKLPLNLFREWDYQSANNKITDYPANSNTYYVFTDRIDRKRTSITAGLFFPRHSKLKIFTGGGYGFNTTLWNVNIYRYYTNSFQENKWVKNSENSFNGPELEAGFFLKVLKKWNLMYGFHLLLNKNQQFRDMSFGIGRIFD